MPQQIHNKLQAKLNTTVETMAEANENIIAIKSQAPTDTANYCKLIMRIP